MNPHRDRRAIAIGSLFIAVAIVGARVCYKLSEWKTLPSGDASNRIKNLEELVHCSTWWSSFSLILIAAITGIWTLVAGLKGKSTWLGPRHINPLLPNPSPSHPRWFWPALLIILLAGISLRAPRLDHSFYNDESHTYTRYVAGIWENYGDENERFRRPPFIDTAFGNQIGNNSLAHSILARLLHDTHRKYARTVDGEVSEWPTRLPPFAAGLATILLLALFFRKLGFWQIGLIAAIIISLHPWHIRYSTESRGYGLALAAITAGFFFMIQALQTGRWRDWSTHGVCQFFALWAYPGAIVTIALTQLGLGAWMLYPAWRAPSLRVNALHHLKRWIVGGVFAVVLTAFLLTPALIQLYEALQEHPATKGQIPEDWWADTLTFLATGCGWQDATPDNPINPTASTSPVIAAGVFSFWSLTAIGLFRCLRSHAMRLPAILIILQILSIPLLYFRSDSSGNILLWWYVLPVLPGLIILAAMRTHSHNTGKFHLPSLAITAILFAGFLPVLTKIIPHGKADGRQIIRTARGGDFPHYDHHPLTFSLWADVATYDPHMRWLDNNQHLNDSILHAEANDLPLYIAVTQEGNAERSHPDVMKRLYDPQQFEIVTTAWALESDVFTTRLYRWRGSP